MTTYDALSIIANDSFKSLFNGFALDLIKNTLNLYISDILFSGAISYLVFESKPTLIDSNLTLKFILLIACKFTSSFLTSPLDLIQTRLINQSSKSPRKYTTILKSLFLILGEEYTLTELYMTKILILPTLAHNFLQILFGHSLPLIADKVLRIRVRSLEGVYLQFLWGILELVCMLPVETVRKRYVNLLRSSCNLY